MINDRNVRQKQIAAIEWVRKINNLNLKKRWEYVLIKEESFYRLSKNGATLSDICSLNKVSLAEAQGVLFDL